MWQKFTERARRVILLAQEEAGKMGSGHVGTEHLLLGLVGEETCVAASVLRANGVFTSDVREEISERVPKRRILSEPKLTPNAKRVLELAANEARLMQHNYIGTEHLLLSLIREEKGEAAKVLHSLGLSLETLHQEVMQYLGDPTETSEVSELESIGKLQMDRKVLNAAKDWAIDEDNYDLASLLRDAVEMMDERIRVARIKQDNQNANSEGD